MKLLSLFLLTTFIFSCASNKEHNHHDESMNEKFLQDDLDVKLWQERFENRDRDVYKAREKIVESLNLQKGQVIADVGAGTGFYLELLHNKVAPEGKVYAVEISPRFVDFLKARSKRENLTNVEVVHGGLDETRLPVAIADKIFVCDTYHHFDRPSNMLKDFRKVLKPKGELIIVDFNREDGKSRKWIIDHIKKTKKQYIEEIEAYGYEFTHESLPGLSENFMLHFRLK